MIQCGGGRYAKDETRGYARDPVARNLQVDAYVDTRFTFAFTLTGKVRRGIVSEQLPNIWLEANRTVDVSDRIDITHISRLSPSARLPVDSVLSRDGIELKGLLLDAIPPSFSYVEFCPYLPALTEVLLCFYDLSEVKTILSRFLCRLRHTGGRLYMFCKWMSFRHVVALTLNYAKNLATLPFIEQWISDHVSDGCHRLLPFGLFVRLCGSVLFEGCKVISRYLLAALKLSIDGKDMKTISSPGDLDALVRRTAVARGKEIAQLAFKLPLSFKEPQQTLPLPELNKTDFPFFKDSTHTQEGYLALFKSIDPLSITRTFRTVFKATQNGFSWKLFEMKLKAARDFVLLVKTKNDFRGFYLVGEFRYMFNESEIIAPINADEVMRLTDGRMFIGGLLTIDGDLSEAAGSCYAESSGIIEIELILVK